MQLAVPFERRPFCVTVAMVAADATKTLVAAPAAGLSLVITKWSYRSTTSAAQAITLAGGATTIDVFAASLVVGTLTEGPNCLEIGVQLPAATALIATPAAAGPAGRFIVEGYIIGGG